MSFVLGKTFKSGLKVAKLTEEKINNLEPLKTGKSSKEKVKKSLKKASKL